MKPLEREGLSALDQEGWWLFLQLTRHPRFLTALPDDEARRRWADLTFAIIEGTGFDLGRLLDQRAGEMPERVLFKDTKEGRAADWTYKQVRRRARTNAAIFLKEGLPEGPVPEGALNDGRPRVALLCENGIGGACCDLACLTHGIFVAPLNVHFNTDNLSWIFDRLDITTAVCDHPDRLEILLAVRDRTRRKFKIFTLNECPLAGQDDIQNLEERRSLLDRDEIAPLLDQSPRMGMRDTAHGHVHQWQHRSAQGCGLQPAQPGQQALRPGGGPCPRWAGTRSCCASCPCSTPSAATWKCWAPSSGAALTFSRPIPRPRAC